MKNALFRVAVFASGRGSNLQAILNACEEKRIGAKVVVVISDNRDAMALKRAGNYSIPAVYLDHTAPNIASQIVECLRFYDVQLVVLAGYRKKIAPEVIRAMNGWIINIHPALDLQRFGGRGMYGERVHQAVLAAREQWSGCTIHFVDPEYDHGAMLLQGRVPVSRRDTADSLAKRVLIIEHLLLPQAIEIVRKAYLMHHVRLPKAQTTP